MKDPDEKNGICPCDPEHSPGACDVFCCPKGCINRHDTEFWLKLFEDFITFQFGAGQASAMELHGKCTLKEAEEWESARDAHYGMDRGEMMRLLRERLAKGVTP